jgi:hypothetical protein
MNMKKRILTTFLVICIIISMFSFVAQSASLTLVYKASEGFSNVQGKNNWSYKYRLSSDSVIRDCDEYTNNKWQPSGATDNCFINATGAHPGSNRDSIRSFTSPYTGHIVLTTLDGIVRSGGQGDGTRISIQKNTAIIHSELIAGSDKSKHDYNLAIDIKKGDELDFIVNRNGENSYDGLNWAPVITYDLVCDFQNSQGNSLSTLEDAVLSGQISANLSYVNRYESSLIIVPIIGLFDENNKLLAYEIQENSLLKGGFSGQFTFNIDFTSGNFKQDSYSGGTLKMLAIRINDGRFQPLISTEIGKLQSTDSNRIYARDFGAVGDGITNDGASLLNAFNAAKQNGSGTTLVFERNATYKLEKVDGRWPYFVLSGTDNLTLDGNGAKILFEKPVNSLISVEKSKNVTIKNLTIDYEETPFTQGMVSNINTTSGTFDLTIDSGYPLPPTDEFMKTNYGTGGWSFGMLIDPVENRLKRGISDHVFINSVNQVSPNIYRVELTTSYKTYLTKFVQNDRFVLKIAEKNYPVQSRSYSGQTINISECENVTVDNVKSYAAPGMWCTVSSNLAGINIKNSGLTYKPNTNRIMTGNSDGIHAKYNKTGPIIDGCIFEGNLDDAINISNMGIPVKALNNTKSFVLYTGYGTDKIKVGDKIFFYDTQNHKKLGDATVTAINIASSGITITTDVDVNNVVAVANVASPTAYSPVTVVYSTSNCGNGAIVRNSTFRNGRRHALLVRATNVTFENNIVDDMGGRAVYAGNELGGFSEGPLPSGLIIQNNTLTDMVNSGCFFIGLYSSGIGDRLIKDIQIKNNTINGIKIGGSSIDANNVSNLIISGNTIIDTDTTRVGNAAVININNCENINIPGSTITDNRTGVPCAIKVTGSTVSQSNISVTTNINPAVTILN